MMSIIKKLFLAVVLTATVATAAYALENVNQQSNLTKGIDDSKTGYVGVGDPDIKLSGIEEPYGYENYLNCITRKLGRGVSNVAFGVFEIPVRIWSVRFEEGGFAGLTYGTFNGIGYFIGREFIGLTDIVTFFMPLPFTPNDPDNGYGWGFGPIIVPEWVLTPETDPWNFVYPNTSFRK